MAVYRHYVECEVCKSITLIRVQAGHLPEYPVRLYCGNCKILFSGKVYFDEEHARVSLILDNCKYIRAKIFDYAIEVSGELPTSKLSKVNNQNEDLDLMYVISPFIRMINSIGSEKYENYFKIISFLRSIGDHWPIIRRINELYLNKKWDLLKDQLIETIPNKTINLINEIDYLMAVHQLTIMSLSEPLKPTMFFENAKLIRNKTFDAVKKSNSSELNEFVEKLNINRLQEKVFILQNTFIERFQYLVPGYSLFYLSRENIDDTQLGVTTATLDDLKSFYIDSFETIMNCIDLVIVMNNIVHRNSCQVMKVKRRDIVSIDQFRNLSNGKKLEFIDGEETLDSLIVNKIDNKLRNALGHSSTRYDGIHQLITYYPNGVEIEENSESLYLIDFIKKCIDQFDVLMSMGEILYTMQKLKMISTGQEPSGVNIFVKNETNSVDASAKPPKKVDKRKLKRKSQKEARKRNRRN